MAYIESSDIEVSRDVVRGFHRRSLRFVADRNAQGVTLGQVRDEPLLLAETITDPCEQAHTVAGCPVRSTRRRK